MAAYTGNTNGTVQRQAGTDCLQDFLLPLEGAGVAGQFVLAPLKRPFHEADRIPAKLGELRDELLGLGHVFIQYLENGSYSTNTVGRSCMPNQRATCSGSVSGLTKPGGTGGDSSPRF